MAKRPAAAAVASRRPRPARSPRAEVERLVARLLDATADADGRGLLLRGEEYQPRTRADFDASVVEPLLRLARLAESVADAVRDNPDQRVRRAAAVLAARAHPLRTALDG